MVATVMDRLRNFHGNECVICCWSRKAGEKIEFKENGKSSKTLGPEGETAKRVDF